MDTSEVPAGGKKKQQQQQQQRAGAQGVGVAKAGPGKRGNRSRNQKRRKSAGLEKALAFAGKFESKAGRADKAGQARKQAKGLWSKDEDGGA